MENGTRFRIVVGIDGSEESKAALYWAVAEARIRDADLEVVTAWHLPAMTGTGLEGVALDPESFRLAAQKCQDDAVGHAALEGFPLRRAVVKGHPARVLQETAHGADLLVVGSRGHGGFAGMLLGSVSAYLVHHSPCTTVVVRPKR